MKIAIILRTFFYSFLLNLSFKKIRVYGPITILHPKMINLKGRVRFNHYVYINARYGITSGLNLTLSSGAKMITTNIDWSKFISNENVDYHKGGPIILGDNVWLGANAIVLPNVSLGNNVIVASGSVVTKSFQENNIILGGIPAKIIKHINE
jgi:acetyltransferase-like isoleucine patch superfamily enzyme